MCVCDCYARTGQACDTDGPDTAPAGDLQGREAGGERMGVRVYLREYSVSVAGDSGRGDVRDVVGVEGGRGGASAAVDGEVGRGRLAAKRVQESESADRLGWATAPPSTR